MTDLQKRQLKILRLVDKVCEQLSIRYFLVCGSALGAVKYKGFIPWDDDLDIGMLRPDYEIFVKNAQKLFPEDYFLQNYRTDPAFPQVFSKVRDSSTTFIEKSAAKLPINHGVYIDIFPLDGYPRNKREAFRLEILKKKYKLNVACVFELPCRWTAKLFFDMERLLGIHRHTQRIIRKYDKLIASYPVTDSKLLCNHGNWQGRLEYAPWEQYGRGTWASFEGMRVRIPAQYDAYLTQKYGDWRADLPQERRVGHHHAEVIDLERPYIFYTKL